MGLGDGLAGAFYIATSGAELFGGELEGLQEAFYKVQAVMSILSGTQQMYNALQKDSAVVVVSGLRLRKRNKNSCKINSLRAAIQHTKSDRFCYKCRPSNHDIACNKSAMETECSHGCKPDRCNNHTCYCCSCSLGGIGCCNCQNCTPFLGRRQGRKRLCQSVSRTEQIQSANAVGASKRAYERQQQVKATDDAEQQALTNAQNRNASEIEPRRLNLTMPRNALMKRKSTLTKNLLATTKRLPNFKKWSKQNNAR